MLRGAFGVSLEHYDRSTLPSQYRLEKVILVAGAQERVAQTAASRLIAAIQDYNIAARAPHTGSATTDALNTAHSRRSEAKRAFDTAYASYESSMRAARQGPRPKTHYVSAYYTL